MMKSKTFQKVAISALIILAVMAIIRKIKTSFFKEMDLKMKALGAPIVAFLLAQFLVKKEEYAQPITIGAVIAFVSGILEVTGSDKFKQEDLGLAGDSNLMTQEFKSVEELNDYIQANMPEAVNGDYLEVFPPETQEEMNGDYSERGRIEEVFGELAGDHSMLVD